MIFAFARCSPTRLGLAAAAGAPPISKRLAGGRTLLYAGEMLETRMSGAGWCRAELARLIGSPLPTSRETNVPAVVIVTADMATGGQIWTRLDARRRGLPQIIHSAKCFAGPTGIEEYLGRGFGMALRIGVRDGALVLGSDRYCLDNLRQALPPSRSGFRPAS